MLNDKEKAKIILAEIEHFLLFDNMQREYATKGILKGLEVINGKEKDLPADQSNSKSIKYLDKYLCLHFKTEKRE